MAALCSLSGCAQSEGADRFASGCVNGPSHIIMWIKRYLHEDHKTSTRSVVSLLLNNLIESRLYDTR
jgi:hypothetical protein